MTAADLPLVPCSECGDTDPAHHVYGLMKCCPDCRHVLADHDRQVAEQALRDAADALDAKSEAEDGLYAGDCTEFLRARADSLAPSAGAPGVAADEREAVLRDAYNDITGDGWGPERTEEVLVRVYDAALAARPAPGVSVSAAQVEAVARVTITPGVNPWSPKFRGGLYAFLAALGVTVTDGGAR